MVNKNEKRKKHVLSGFFSTVVYEQVWEEEKEEEGDRRHPIVVYIDNAFILYMEGRVLCGIVFLILFSCRLRSP